MKKLFYFFSYVVFIIAFIIPADSFSQRTKGPIVLYTFEEVVDGNIIKDVSDSDPIIDLEMTSGVTKIPDRNGVVISNADNSYSQGLFSQTPPTGLASIIQTTKAMTVEIWTLPVDTNQWDARMVSYSFDGGNRNFSFILQYGGFEVRLRTALTDNNGYNVLFKTGTAFDTENPDAFHAVYTFDQGVEKVYLNAELLAEFTDRGDDISNWDNTYPFVIGTENNNSETRRQYEGEVYLVAIYEVALTEDEIESNYFAGYENPFPSNSPESKDLNQNYFNVFPNPASDELSLKLNDNFSGRTYLTLYNCLGGIMMEETFSGSEHRMDISTLPSGVYLIALKNKQGNIVKKIIKK